jgi:hypothetical protein
VNADSGAWIFLPHDASIPKLALLRDNHGVGPPTRKTDQPGAVSLPDKARLIRSVIMAGIMTLVVTAVITFINLGLQPDFLRRWMIAWAVAWPVAAIAAFVAVPVADRVTAFIIEKLDDE